MTNSIVRVGGGNDEPSPNRSTKQMCVRQVWARATAEGLETKCFFLIINEYPLFFWSAQFPVFIYSRYVFPLAKTIERGSVLWDVFLLDCVISRVLARLPGGGPMTTAIVGLHDESLKLSFKTSSIPSSHGKRILANSRTQKRTCIHCFPIFITYLHATPSVPNYNSL